MAKKKKSKKIIRAEFRKHRDSRTRKNDLTRQFNDDAESLDNIRNRERVSGKGDLTRKRTVVGAESKNNDGSFQVDLEVDDSKCVSGRVIRIHGLESIVKAEDGQEFRCSIRGVLKSLASDLQHVVVAGDQVTIQLIDEEIAVIVRVDNRKNLISRTSRGRQQILAANVDRLLIVASAAEPMLKPNLIDRYLISSEKANIQPVIVINKMDLIDPADVQPLIGTWCQMGYPVILTSTESGFGITRLRELVQGVDTVVTGQSGVGKSSILNAIEPGLELKVSHVSAENQKGRHTTTAAELVPLKGGGYLIDTPGIRQFQLWDIIPEEVGGYFRDIRPFINSCRFPDCTHTHEDECGVKWAVADGKIDVRRYESYCQMRETDN